MRALGLACALLAPSVALAQTAQVNCANPQAQVEINFCAEQAWMRADAQLNQAWQEAKAMAKSLDAGLPPAQQGIWQALLDGQRAWLTYRDKTCEAEGGLMRGGSGESMLIYGCRHRITDQRVSELMGFAQRN